MTANPYQRQQYGHPPYQQPLPQQLPHTPARPSRAAGVLHLVSVVTLGLMAGLFFAYDISVMPGLAHTDDRTYVTAMQQFNAEIDGNGLFALVFCGAIVAAGVAAFLEFRRGHRTIALWAGLAAVLYLFVLMLTMGVEIPLNNQLADLGDPAKIHDFALVEKFKGTWETVNIVRTLLCTAALGCAAYAARLHGRTEA
ncbi:anthrone oxygenase family protein [Streptomyces sp. WG-D5]